MAVTRLNDGTAFTSAVRIQYTDELTDVFKDYRNPDGLAVEFTIEKPTLSILNLPVPIEARYVKFKIQVSFLPENMLFSIWFVISLVKVKKGLPPKSINSI